MDYIFNSSNDVITIDLSPQRRDIWGDYARTIILETTMPNGIIFPKRSWERTFFFQVYISAYLNMQTHPNPYVEVWVHREPTFRTQSDITIGSVHSFGLHNMQLPSTWLKCITNCCWFSARSLLGFLIYIFLLASPDLFMILLCI